MAKSLQYGGRGLSSLSKFLLAALRLVATPIWIDGPALHSLRQSNRRDSSPAPVSLEADPIMGIFPRMIMRALIETWPDCSTNQLSFA